MPSFPGEERRDGESTPRQDLVAALAVAAIAVTALVLALELPVLGRAYSAPGLVPALTAASLLLMAIGLGVLAVRRGAIGGAPGLLRVGNGQEGRRTLLLIGFVFLYVLLLDVMPFEFRFRLAGVAVRLSSFECVSVLMLAAILRAFWRASLVRCGLVSAIVVLALATMFRYWFKILLPGLD